MSNNRVSPRAGVRNVEGASIARAAPWAGLAMTALVLAGLVLAGCSNPEAGPAASKLRVYAVDLAGGAKVCEVPKVNLFAGAGSEVPMKLVNDGGWCGIRMSQDGAKPFDAGLLTARPAHGTVLIHEVGDDTRIDYTPDRGFAGNDTFAVKLIPGNVAVQVTVAVTAPNA